MSLWLRKSFQTLLTHSTTSKQNLKKYKPQYV